jgi:hypothetical protein
MSSEEFIPKTDRELYDAFGFRTMQAINCFTDLANAIGYEKISFLNDLQLGDAFRAELEAAKIDHHLPPHISDGAVTGFRFSGFVDDGSELTLKGLRLLRHLAFIKRPIRRNFLDRDESIKGFAIPTEPDPD